MSDEKFYSEEEIQAAIDLPFPGTPRTYLKIAIWGSLGIHAYLFFGYWGIKYFLAGETWPNGWFVPVATLISALFFIRFSYRWIMRLDAQYGRGSGWRLESTQVKLPWERLRKRKK